MNKLVSALDQVFESNQKDPKEARAKSLMESVQRHRLQRRIAEKAKLNEFERNFVDDVFAAIEDGFLSYETVAIACLKYMSTDDVKDMARLNDWHIADDEDFDDYGDYEDEEEGEE